MKFNVLSLQLIFRQEQVLIPLASVAYFWGQMGAGKTSIAKMIDYCLGGNVELSPAMQSEFVAAGITLELQTGMLTIERERESSGVVASWGNGPDASQLILPARVANGIVLPGTEVETLSDLIFHLSGLRPPRVRKSKKRDDSDSARLSIRDLLWYCYLDQDNIDSSFFYLQRGGDPFRQLKSRDVLRYIIGFHDEKVAELEAELDRLRGERIGISATIDSLRRALKQVGIEIEARRKEFLARDIVLRDEIAALRARPELTRPTEHAADSLRDSAISLGREIAELDDASADLAARADQDRRHLHELETLSVRLKRSASAREVLSGVKFHSCPSCAQLLPDRAAHLCHVCGQPDVLEVADPQEAVLVEKDLRQRLAELKDIIQRHDEAAGINRRRREELLLRKRRVEGERNEAMARYDSAYLSTVLAKEHERAAITQDIVNLEGLSRFPRLLDEQTEQLGRIAAAEAKAKTALRAAKEAAKEDETNLNDLKTLFLDCLLRAKVPGISARDEVEIPKTDFIPVIRSDSVDDATETSFTTLSSGGKKTLFKCCFAVAVHRLSANLGAPLPTFLLIDSPMKNISERENRQQFHSFADIFMS